MRFKIIQFPLLISQAYMQVNKVTSSWFPTII